MYIWNGIFVEVNGMILSQKPERRTFSFFPQIIPIQKSQGLSHMHGMICYKWEGSGLSALPVLTAPPTPTAMLNNRLSHAFFSDATGSVCDQFFARNATVTIIDTSFTTQPLGGTAHVYGDAYACKYQHTHNTHTHIHTPTHMCAHRVAVELTNLCLWSLPFGKDGFSCRGVVP